MTPTADSRRLLLVANAYPSDAHLYRNTFIHSRVKAYQAAGLEVDVFCVGPTASPDHYTFDGVAVEVGGPAAYRAALRRGNYAKVLIHFARDFMVRPLLEEIPETPVIVWVHGFETEQWHRRWFNLLDDPVRIREALKNRDTIHAPQLAFMRWLFTTDQLDVTVVQVSEWFRDHVSEADVGARARRSVVIPNLIDTEHFVYRPRTADDRLKLLSIRPYASYKYANDQTVAAIGLLAEKPFFGELSFHLYGEGPLHARTVAPVRGLPNVHIHERFVRHEEIPAIHAQHGVFLTPTRFDSQGVSMCEAMSSGLVPLATDVAAIPEYVQHGVDGLLAAPESPADLAAHVETLYRDPELFLRLSEQAAASMRRTCGHEQTIAKELELITA